MVRRAGGGSTGNCDGSARRPRPPRGCDGAGGDRYESRHARRRLGGLADRRLPGWRWRRGGGSGHHLARRRRRWGGHQRLARRRHEGDRRLARRQIGRPWPRRNGEETITMASLDAEGGGAAAAMPRRDNDDGAKVTMGRKRRR